MDYDTQLTVDKYCHTSYKDIIKAQIYLADSANIPFDYTDLLSFSELDFLLNTFNEYAKEKAQAINSV